jgi:ribose transport system ATP-binding protein
MTHDRLVDLIAGKELAAHIRASDHAAPRSSLTSTKGSRLHVSNLSGGPVKNFDLELQLGEIVGLVGLVGSGRSSILEMIFGLLPPVTGDLALDGNSMSFNSRPHEAVAYVPEDRLTDAAFNSLSVLENLMAASTDRFWRRFARRSRQERAEAAQLVQKFRVKVDSELAAFSTLSGGNQQKVIVARWLSCEPSVLLLDEPSQGVDVGARAEIHQLIRDAATGGTGVLVASSDLDEVVALCDRALVLSEGRVVANVEKRMLSVERLERLAYVVGSRNE